MRIREITPFLHASLYQYPRFETYEEIETSGIHVWGALTKEYVKQIQQVTPETESPDKFEIQMPMPIPVVAPVTSTDQPSRFTPRKPDSLFWAMYIAKNSVHEFFNIGSKYMNKELEEKYKIMEFMRANRPLLKSMKITADKGQEIMGELLTNKQTELTVVQVFAIFYQARIWIVSENSHTYLEFLPKPMENDEDENSDAENVVKASTPIFLLYHSKSGSKFASYAVETNVREETLTNIRDNMLRIENIAQPLKSVSTYKVVDLEKIVELLTIQPPDQLGTKTSTSKWKKGDMYNTIRTHCISAWIT